MKRLPRLLPCIAIACSMTVSALYAAPKPAAKTPPAARSSAKADPAAAQTAADETKADAKPDAPADAAPPADAKPDDAAAMPKDAPPADAPKTDAGTDAAAPDTTATTEPAPASQPVGAVETAESKTLHDDVDNFWYYAAIGRYDLANVFGNRVLARPDSPVDVLKAFEAEAQSKPDHPDLMSRLIGWQSIDQLKDISGKIIKRLNEGQVAQRQDQQFILANVQRLGNGERAYANALANLRRSGELAVPALVTTLRDPNQAQLHDAVRQALIDMGRQSLNPLVAATDMRDNNDALITVVGVLGEIQFDAAAPYLVKLTTDRGVDNGVKTAATNALHRMGVNASSVNDGDLFYDLAEKFYYRTAAIQADSRNPSAQIWFWNKDHLTPRAVPIAVFNDYMATREAENALRQNTSKADDAMALFLAANIRREVDQSQGQADPAAATQAAANGDYPPAHFYNVSAGAKYLNLVLDRSLNDRNSAVALRAIKSLQEIVGQSNLFSGGRGEPLVQAMRYADRLVRFEAAFALANALPQQRFQGQERVIPLLAEAVSQTGQGSVLVIAPSEQDRTRLATSLKAYAVSGGTNAQGGIAQAASLPAVDVILMPEELGDAEIHRVFALASQNPRLERAAKLIIVHSRASNYAREAINNPTITVTTANGGAGLAQAIEEARRNAGSLPLDEKLATAYSLRAAELLGKLAISRGQVLDLAAAEPTLLASLNDKRPEIAKAVGDVLALLNSKQSQIALADRANDEKTPDEVRVSLYKSLATSAKFFGNQLESAQVGPLQKVVDGAPKLDVRSAAAEARGALNLPAQDARTLITKRRD